MSDTRPLASLESSRLRRMLVRAFLVIGGTLAGLLLGEVGLRVAGTSFPVFDTYDRLRGVRLRPGMQGWYSVEGRAFLSINSLGYRDVEHAIDKPVNGYRIAVLGDSFIEARQVAREDSITVRLSEDLRSCAELTGREIEVLSFGIGGYATTEEILTFRHDVRQFSPDLVVLGFFAGNDIRDNSRELSRQSGWRMQRPFFVVRDGALVLDDHGVDSVWRRLLYEGTHRSRVLQAVNEGRRAWTVRRLRRAAAVTDSRLELGTDPEVFVPPSDPLWTEAYVLTERLLGQLARETRAAGAELVVVNVTLPPQVQPDPEVRKEIAAGLGADDLLYPDRWLEQVGERGGFAVITLAARLQAIATRDRVYLHGFANSVIGQGHWNETGHRLAARLVADDLCGRGLLIRRGEPKVSP